MRASPAYGLVWQSYWFHFTGYILKDLQHLKSLTALHASKPEHPLQRSKLYMHAQWYMHSVGCSICTEHEDIHISMGARKKVRIPIDVYFPVQDRTVGTGNMQAWLIPTPNLPHSQVSVSSLFPSQCWHDRWDPGPCLISAPASGSNNGTPLVVGFCICACVWAQKPMQPLFFVTKPNVQHRSHQVWMRDNGN